MLRRLGLCLWLLVLVGCQTAPPPPPTPTTTPPPTGTAVPPTATRPPTASPTAPPSPTPPPTQTPLPTDTPAPTATPAPTSTPTRTPDAYSSLDLEGLRARSDGGGEIETVRVLEERPEFTRYLIQYPSDGLRITGVMDVPTGEGPFPVVIVNHGFIQPTAYRTTTAYTLPLADHLARNGYLTLHPDYRTYGGSDRGPNPFRIGYAIDVLNLVQLAKALPNVQPDRIGMLGHSMGGGITTRVMVVTSDVKAVVLYGAMSADEVENYNHRVAKGWTSNEAQFGDVLPVTPKARPDVYERISPMSHLEYVTAPVSVHHGQLDTEVPPRFSDRLVRELRAAGRDVDYFVYLNQPHWFTGQSQALFLERVVQFFDRHLKAVP